MILIQVKSRIGLFWISILICVLKLIIYSQKIYCVQYYPAKFRPPVKKHTKPFSSASGGKQQQFATCLLGRG